MQKTFNTTNPESLNYQSEEIEITVMGGVKLNGLERMRVTLKVEYNSETIRHSLDLYNDTQVLKFTRKVAERMEIGTSIIGEVLNELTTELENYRLEQLDLKKVDAPTKKALTEIERNKALDFLKSADLLQVTNETIGTSGMIGEENNRLLMYLIFTSRKREQPLHIVSLGASGMGKTHLQEKVGELIPEEDKIEITTLSENAFYYFGQQELQNKLILIEDLDGAEGAMYPLRELQSKKRISKTVAKKTSTGETRTISLTVEGPVSVAGCTTKESLYEDNANRSFLIFLDESEEQDERIMNYQRRASSGEIDQIQEKKAAELLRNCQRILEPIKVVNPYAPQLKIPKEVFKARRTNSHYLAFIEAVTFYHQYQREQKVNEATGEIFIETTLEDIAESNKLLKQILLRKSDDLTGACRNYFEKLKLYLIGEEEKEFTNREISQKLRIPIATVKRMQQQLLNNGYLNLLKKDKNKGYEYEIVSYEEYKNLQSNIENVLDNQLTSLQVAQPSNEPVKKLKTNKKKQVAQ
jgi:predicted transcriptional regulator